jgi:hypothetical protein
MTPTTQTALNINAHALAFELCACIEGEVRFDAGSRALFTAMTLEMTPIYRPLMEKSCQSGNDG